MMCPVGHPAKRRHEITVNIELPSHKANTCWVIVTVENTFQMFFVGDEGRRARSAHSPFSMPELDGGTGWHHCALADLQHGHILSYSELTVRYAQQKLEWSPDF
ncbi:MAG: hypothetical protein M3Y27_25980 [Acidobacteriota bacterium]|nr:hypothetical protein [Acidobacteriota bacterium]